MKPERMSKKMKEYYEKEEKRVKERTEEIKKESKVEREVRMLKEVTKEPEVMSKKYVGEIISKKGKRIVMYIKKKGWIMEMEEKEEEKEEIGSEKEIRIYVFENEENMSRKVRIGGT
jgi:nitrate/nitrite-specific signal transduction histidine kinase